MENDINELINTRMNSGETAVRIISTLYSFFLKKKYNLFILKWNNNTNNNILNN